MIATPSAKPSSVPVSEIAAAAPARGWSGTHDQITAQRHRWCDSEGEQHRCGHWHREGRGAVDLGQHREADSGDNE